MVGVVLGKDISLTNLLRSFDITRIKRQEGRTFTSDLRPYDITTFLYDVFFINFLISLLYFVWI